MAVQTQNPASSFPTISRNSTQITASSSKIPSGTFDVITAYQNALKDEKVPHPVAAILALVELIEASTASTVTGLAQELTAGRQVLIDTQPSLGVRAGCQLWERFFALSGMGEEFPAYKRSLIGQGRAFCSVTAPRCREKIAALAVDFLRDDCIILTHSYSRTVCQTILRAHSQHKRIKVYVTEARPSCLGLKTYNILTEKGIPCTVVSDSAVAYIMDRVHMVLVGSEAVVESGGLVSSVGTYQVALIAKAMQKPFYALAESYKFLRHYPLSQTDLPTPRHEGKSSRELPLSFPTSYTTTNVSRSEEKGGGQVNHHLEMTKEMMDRNPSVDVTTPDLIDFIITDLGAPLSPTSVSQYLVAQFSS